MTAPIGTIANRFTGLRELSNVTNTYGGYLTSSGAALDLVLPWQADKLEVYNYTTGANPIVWFRDMAAGTALGGGIGSSSSYGYVYALTQAATVALEAPVLWDTAGPLNGVVFTPGSGNVTVAKAGLYKVEFSVSGTEPNQFAIAVNGTANASTIYGSGAGTQQNTGFAILTLAAGDVLSVINHSSSGGAVTLAPNVGGTQNNVRASIIINSIGSTSGSLILTNGVTIDNLLGGFTNEHLVISGITTAGPAVVTTTTNHNLSNMDRVVITKVIGTMAAQINNQTYVVQVLSPTTFALYDVYGLPIVTIGTYTSSGQVTKMNPALGDVTEPVSPAVPHQAVIDYPPMFRLLLGTSVVGADGDILFFEATMMNAYFNLGDFV